MSTNYNLAKNEEIVFAHDCQKEMPQDAKINFIQIAHNSVEE